MGLKIEDWIKDLERKELKKNVLVFLRPKKGEK